MPDIKFSCPNCQQHIQAEPGYAGMQIACPACHASMTVPGTRPAPVAAAAPARALAQAAPAVATPPLPTANACPSCGGALARGAVLCTSCGYNLATGQRTVAGGPAPLGKPAAAQRGTPLYKTAYPYVGGVLLILGGLYFLGRDNPGAMLAFLGLAILYAVTVHIIVVVTAFRESAGHGFLTLCIPFYALYFVYKVNENSTLQILYTAAVVINLGLRFLDLK